MSPCVPSLTALSDRFAGPDARIHPALPIAAMVAGFALWWPLGLAVLVLWRGAAFVERRGGLSRRGWRPAAATGNTAFDSHRAAVLQRLEAERRALDDQQREFGAFLDQLKRARDREEFDRFMQGRGPAAG